MSRQFLLILPALFKLSNSLPWDGPPQSLTATNTANWSPVPTNDFQEDFRLLPRAFYPNSVCGFVGGSVAIPAVCSTDSSCAWNSDEMYVGCCATADNACTFYTSCVDGNSPKQEGDKADVYTCPGSSVCYRNTYPHSYYQWGCGSSDWATFVATTNEDLGAPSVQVVITGNANAAPSTVESAPASSNPAAPTKSIVVTQVITTSASASSSTSSSESTESSNSAGASSTVASSSSTSTTAPLSQTSNTPLPSTSTSPPIGAIIGGAVGGLALLFALLCFCFIGRRRGWFSKSNPDNDRNPQLHYAGEVPPRYSTPMLVSPAMAHNMPPEIKAELPAPYYNVREQNREGSYGMEEVSPVGSPVPVSEGTMGSRSRVASPVLVDELFLPTTRRANRVPVFEVQ